MEYVGSISLSFEHIDSLVTVKVFVLILCDLLTVR